MRCLTLSPYNKDKMFVTDMYTKGTEAVKSAPTLFTLMTLISILVLSALLIHVYSTRSTPELKADLVAHVIFGSVGTIVSGIPLLTLLLVKFGL